MPRASNRLPHQLRDIHFERNFTMHAEGSVLACFGNTMVLCTASIERSLPFFLRNSSTRQGWLTAEYSMLPRSTNQRCQREAARGKQTGRTQEIQRLIGRSLRASVNLLQIPDITITIDCDVIQADGGTRTAAITGSCIALADALTKVGKPQALVNHIAAISVGVVDTQVLVDLDYGEDSRAMTDMNLVMDEHGKFIEIQGTAEQQSFSQDELSQMLGAGSNAIADLIKLQAEALKGSAG